MQNSSPFSRLYDGSRKTASQKARLRFGLFKISGDGIAVIATASGASLYRQSDEIIPAGGSCAELGSAMVVIAAASSSGKTLRSGDRRKQR
jgi:hypothetical protein